MLIPIQHDNLSLIFFLAPLTALPQAEAPR